MTTPVEHIGERLHSPFFGRDIIITRWNSDTDWFFRFAELKPGEKPREWEAQTPYSVLLGMQDTSAAQ
jgi:hypothetical protein